MDRIIEVKVGGNYIRKDKKTAGVRGEYEVAILRIEFDESWDEYAKSITFWDARGLNHVFRELDPTKLENHAQSERVFLVPIPEEPMAVAGEMTFVIDGIAEGKKQRSVSDKLEVKDAPMSEDAKPPVEPTPNDVEQMRLELGKINNGILAALTARDQIMNMQVDAETLETGEPAYVNSSWNEYHDAVALHFGLPKGDTGDSGVHIGDEAPSDPDVNVWISSDAMPSILRIKDENGTWHDITAVRGLSAYEIALQNGFEGSEKEWIDKVEAEARMAEEARVVAEEARVVADLSASNALQSAQNAALSEEATYTQSNRAYNQAERAMEYALASGESSSSSLAFSEQAREYAGASGESATTSKSWADESFRQSQAAREYALLSDESATSSHAFAEEAKASADKAEQHANEFSGDVQRIEAGLTYLKDFLKDRPQGLYVDDLDNLTYENTGGGVFLWGKPQDGTKQNDIVFVTQGLSPMRDELTTFQMKISLATAYPEPNRYNIKQRYRKHNSQGDFVGWSEWEDIYTTYKKVPYGKSIDDLYGEEHLGWYMGKVKSNFTAEYNPGEDFHFLFVNDGWTISDMGDIADYFQTRFIWDGFNYRIQTRKGSGGYWSDWQDVFGGGGDDTRFPVNPQIDMTVEEEIKLITINAINNENLSDFGYTAMKILIENVGLGTSGGNSEICAHINCQQASFNKTTLNAPTTFIANATKQYWGGYIDIKSGLVVSGAIAGTMEQQRVNMTMPCNSSNAHMLDKLEYINIQSIGSIAFPIGTKIKLWFK